MSTTRIERPAMKISASYLTLQASHSYIQRDERRESLEAWVGERSNAPTAQISAAGQALSSQASTEQSAIDNATKAAENDPFLLLVKQVLEWLTGKPVKVFTSADWKSGQGTPASAQQVQDTTQAPAQKSAGYGIAYDFHQSHSETETTQVSMQGTVLTADGKSIQLNLSLSMSRSFTSATDISIRAGDARRKDPLVINFGGNAAQLQDGKFSFDLNNDGNRESIAQLAPGSGYLAFDRNGNGRIDNGSELFGPATDSGFGELAALDSDHNGWLDENDNAYSKLSVWQPGADGNGQYGGLQSLAQHQIGALYLGRVATPFALRGSQNSDLGMISASGLYLREDGSTGTLQEVDLSV